MKSSFRESGANRIPNCIQLLTSFVIIATAAINKANAKNIITPSTITSSIACGKGKARREVGSSINCWKRCRLVSAVNKAISLMAVSTINLPTSWLWATCPFLR